MTSAGNLFTPLPEQLPHEETTELVARPSVKIERIVSRAHASPPGFWYDQEWAEWVLVLSGSADLQIAGEPAPRRLKPGDYVDLPAHTRHRVAWTDTSQPTIWLAVHYR